MTPRVIEEGRAKRREPYGTVSAWVAAGSFALIAALSFAVDQALTLSPAPDGIELVSPWTGDSLAVLSPMPFVRSLFGVGRAAGAGQSPVIAARAAERGAA